MDHEKCSQVDDKIKCWLAIKRKGDEKEIEFAVVVEFLRFLFYTWFCLIVIVGMALTYGFSTDNYGKIIGGVFGSVNVCAYFDFPPATYVLPAMYSIQIVLIYYLSNPYLEIVESFSMIH